eukprot:Blabericola_migrator_1__9797@NODE_537_length_7753_cov_19_354411_g206_i1_p2_GENE_NODE_537_length_7753_cov_19_354411_g206_i1NODE_537_length_7753_cov_19_354411_g206_i1_p2_ORF_typecomplete_len493_score91_36Sipho_Gp157/PF05565_11/1_2Sipho_Gp157/PF05565_11/4_9e03_NODE_537_length_7753_cov_19_354411_g206_i12231701
MSGARYLQYGLRRRLPASRILALMLLTIEPTIAGKRFFSLFKSDVSMEPPLRKGQSIATSSAPIPDSLEKVKRATKKEVERWKELALTFMNVVDDANRVAEVSAYYKRFINPIMEQIKENFIQSSLRNVSKRKAGKSLPLPDKRDMEILRDMFCQVYVDLDPTKVSDIIKSQIQSVGLNQWKRQCKPHVDAAQILICNLGDDEKTQRLLVKLDEKWGTAYQRWFARQCDVRDIDDKLFTLCLEKTYLLPKDLLESKTSLASKLAEAFSWTSPESDLMQFDGDRYEGFVRDLKFYLGPSTLKVSQSVMLSQAQHDAFCGMKGGKHDKSVYAQSLRSLFYCLLERIEKLEEIESEYQFQTFKDDLRRLKKVIASLDSGSEVRSMTDALEDLDLSDVDRFWRRWCRSAEDADFSESSACLFALYNVCIAMLATAAKNRTSKFTAEKMLQVVECINQYAQFPIASIKTLRKIVKAMGTGLKGDSVMKLEWVSRDFD